MHFLKRIRARLFASHERISVWYVVLLFAVLQFAFLQVSVTGHWSRIVPLQAHALTVLLVNIALILLGMLLAMALFNNIWAAAFLAVCITAAIAIANRIKISLLGSAIEPAADLHRARDVLPFLGGILFRPRSLVWLLLLLSCGFLAFYQGRRHPVGGWDRKLRLRAGLLCFLTLAGFPALARWLPKLHLYTEAKTDWMYCCAQDGVPLSYMANLDDVGPRRAIEPPVGYGQDGVRAACVRILREYRPALAPSRPPDIVLIAAEAMMDPTALPNISHPVDWLSSVHRLQGEQRPYQLVSPSLGGMSINADFEVLTGFSTRFIGSEEDCVADYLERPIPSLARILKSRGYETVAIVPTPRTLFRHEWVFKRAFGFDRAFFEDDMGGRMEDIPDSETAKRILKVLDTPSSRPRFVYAQFERNHLPWDQKKHYSYPKVVPASPLTGADASTFNVYIQGVYETDQVIGDLASSLQERKSPTVLAVYGDHLPALGNSVLRAIGVGSGVSSESRQGALAMHTTPGLIWATDGRRPTRADGVTGMNYFIAYLLEAGGISHPYYTGFLMTAHADAPAINHHLVCAPGGEPVGSVPTSSRAVMDDYELLQYDMIFGKRYAAESLFPEMK